MSYRLKWPSVWSGHWIGRAHTLPLVELFGSGVEHAIIDKCRPGQEVLRVTTPGDLEQLDSSHGRQMLVWRVVPAPKSSPGVEVKYSLAILVSEHSVAVGQE